LSPHCESVWGKWEIGLGSVAIDEHQPAITIVVCLLVAQQKIQTPGIINDQNGGLMRKIAKWNWG
jgi:hypothetical protein